VRKEKESTILETIARRPCTLEDLSVILGMHVNELNKYLGILETAGKIHTRRQGVLNFYVQGPSEKSRG
jgi:predicted transcriptional regulator